MTVLIKGTWDVKALSNFLKTEQNEKGMENIVLKKSNKISKAKVRLSRDQGPCVVGGFVGVNGTLQTRVLTGPPTTQETVPLSNLFSLHIILLTYCS